MVCKANLTKKVSKNPINPNTTNIHKIVIISGNLILKYFNQKDKYYARGNPITMLLNVDIPREKENVSIKSHTNLSKFIYAFVFNMLTV